MKYVIHNVKDSYQNILGLNYSVLVLDPSFDLNDTNRKVVQEGEKSDIIERKAFPASYDSNLQHKSAIMNALEWIMEDSIKRDQCAVVQMNFFNLKKE